MLRWAGLMQWRFAVAMFAIVFPVGLLVFAFSGCDIRQRAAKHACRDGSAAECLAVGTFYESRTDGLMGFLLSNAVTAETYYDRGCTLGSFASCARFGHMIVGELYDSARDSSFTQRQGLTALEKACDGGETDACRELASALVPAEAAPILEKLCNGGDKASCDKLAAAYRDSDPKRADELLTKRCDGGDNGACRDLASTLLGSNGSGADAERAVAVLMKACDRSAWGACRELGEAYVDGTLPAEPDRARDLFEKGCDHRDIDCCFDYGKALIDTDPAKAVQIFTADCEHDARGCDALGDIYRVGADGIPRDRDRARSFYRASCEAGSMYSCHKRDCYDADQDACGKAFHDQRTWRYRLGGRFDIR